MRPKNNYDFCGWATRNDVRCSDGRTIRKDAFKDNDGETVPLVWNHLRSEPANVLGHALLENRDEGVYAYGYFNDTEAGELAKTLVKHGDIRAMSIYANGLKQHGGDVLHGAIREVSLVYASANPRAYIEQVLAHSDRDLDENDEGIFMGEGDLSLEHADSGEKKDEKGEADVSDTAKKPEEGDETLEDVFNTLTEKQKKVVYAMLAMQEQAMKHSEEENEEDDETMKHNVFDQEQDTMENSLTHDEFNAIINDGKRYGSLRDSFLAHGIDQIDYMFPDAKNLNTPPDFISREMGWVRTVMSGVHHTPFSRIKSMFANITEDDARARGYIKGNQKVDEVFGLLKRTTTPTTVYKKQSLDRDDIVDITDFDVLAWLKSEMRTMLDEELARAFLIGDGRSAASNDKINEGNIRPIMTDDNLYTIKRTVTYPSNPTDDQKAKAFIRAAVHARKEYKGTGEPTLFTTEDNLIMMRLMEDGVGHILYDSDAKLASALRVKNIVSVPVMEGVTGPLGGSLLGIIVNLSDYNVGADKGGAVNMFDDFDIDYNKQKYLIETRCSGALIKPFSAIVLETATGATVPTYTAVTPASGANPAALGYYEKIMGEYVPTQDETVVSRKTYYELDD